MKANAFLLRSVLLGGFSFALALGSIACSDTAGAPSVGPEYVDLFACNVQLSCPMYCAHLGVEACDGSGSINCAGDLWLSGTKGAIMLQDRPGPGNWMGDELTLLQGNGKALVQKRTRSCLDGGASCNPSDLPWELGAHELCDVKVPPSNCQPGNCELLPQVENCVPVEKDWTCAEANAAISPAP